MALHEIIYVSLASHDMAEAELLQLLDEARVYNVAHGITGLLMYHRRGSCRPTSQPCASARATRVC